MTLLLLLAALASPAPQTFDVGRPGDAYALANFYRAEADATGNYRWSAPDSRLLLGAAYDGPLVLTLRLRAAGFAPPELWRLELRRDGRPVAAFATRPEPRTYRVLLPPDAAPEPPEEGQEPLELAAPAARPGPDDPRSLGVALDAFTVAPLPGSPPPPWPLLGRALPLAWAVALVAALGQKAEGRRQKAEGRGQKAEGRGRSGVVRKSPRLLAMLADPRAIAFALGLALALWAWRDPLGFAWGVPTPPIWLLIVATAGAGAWITKHTPWGETHETRSRETRGGADSPEGAARPGAPPPSRVRERGPGGEGHGRPPQNHHIAPPADAPPADAPPADAPPADAPPADAPPADAAHRAPTALLVAVLAGHLLLLAPLPWRGLGALLILGLPGALAARLLFPGEPPATRAFLALCGALCVAPLLTMALHAIPGPLHGWALVLAADLLAAGMGASLYRGRAQGSWGEEGSGASRPRLLTADLAILVFILGALLRLALLGSAEFQGDEARAMLLASAVVQGADGALLSHTKGPAEALLPAGVLAIAGGVDELAARLPFALAGIGVLLAVPAILAAGLGNGGRRPRTDARYYVSTDTPGRLRQAQPAAPWPEPAEWVEGHAPRPAFLPSALCLLPLALLAVDGFAVGFARIVQYQGLVMLMSAGAFWCAWRFYVGAPHPQRYLVSAAALLAVGLLAHYDAAFVAPALAWLTIAGGLRRGWRPVAWLRGLAPASLLGAGLLAAFYLPFALGESFARTAEYLAGRAAEGDSGGPPFNNLALYLDILGFYNAPPLAPLLAAMLVASLIILLLLPDRGRSIPGRSPRPPRYATTPPLSLLAALALGAAALAQALDPAIFALPGGGSWAILAFGPPLAALCLLPGQPPLLRALALWFSAPFLGMAFLIAEPRTHFYAMHLPAALLIGLALRHRGAGKRQKPPFSLVPFAFSLVPFALCLLGFAYAQLVYLRQFPEYQRAFPAARPDWLRAGYGDQLPEAGYFGFPHRDGWKAAAELYAAGDLAGTYDTNQNRWLAGWYLGAATRCPAEPDYYLIAEQEPSQYFPPGYYLHTVVTSGPSRALAIYARAPVAGPPRQIALEELAAQFDRRPAPPHAAGAILSELIPRRPLEYAWPTGVLLRGYDLPRGDLRPGDSLPLTLYWQADRPQPGLTPAVELRDPGGRPVLTAAPSCAAWPARDWPLSPVNPVPFRLALPADLAPGSYTLHAGLRDEAGAWLPQSPNVDAPQIEVLVVQ